MEALLNSPPPKVDSSDWSAFVHYYNTEKMKKLAARNTTNRKKLKVSHAGGSKSNARKASQMAKKLGRPVCRSEVVLSNLIKKNGSYVNEEAETLVAKISENLSQDQEHAALSGVPSKIYAQPNDALGKVFGPEHPGRVRGLGVGACPSKDFGLQGHVVGSVRTSTSSDNNQTDVRIEDLVKQVNSLQDNLVGYQETKLELSQTQAKLTTLHKFLQDKFGSDVPNLEDISHL
ncbi:uncharacterized protein G2W53_014120 [Senna tora]|uniref:Uncharacterized protein n=1 Tax=Senna tora TaxID=362788 RepID=A0A834WSX2_9FABA|nr:uncharacterized protein G2W53_014120 [Senna tora]